MVIVVAGHGEGGEGFILRRYAGGAAKISTTASEETNTGESSPARAACQAGRPARIRHHRTSRSPDFRRHVRPGPSFTEIVASIRIRT